MDKTLENLLLGSATVAILAAPCIATRIYFSHLVSDRMDTRRRNKVSKQNIEVGGIYQVKTMRKPTEDSIDWFVYSGTIKDFNKEQGEITLSGGVIRDEDKDCAPMICVDASTYAPLDEVTIPFTDITEIKRISEHEIPYDKL